MKALVMYYSRTGNAKFIAEKIAQEVNADIEESGRLESTLFSVIFSKTLMS